jgi:hypothetical protein
MASSRTVVDAAGEWKGECAPSIATFDAGGQPGVERVVLDDRLEAHGEPIAFVVNEVGERVAGA